MQPSFRRRSGETRVGGKIGVGIHLQYARIAAGVEPDIDAGVIAAPDQAIRLERERAQPLREHFADVGGGAAHGRPLIVDGARNPFGFVSHEVGQSGGELILDFRSRKHQTVEQNADVELSTGQELLYQTILPPQRGHSSGLAQRRLRRGANTGRGQPVAAVFGARFDNQRRS